MEFIYNIDQDQIEKIEKKLSPKEFLLSYPRGVYTLGIFTVLSDFNDHLERLCKAVSDFYNTSIDIQKLWKLIKFSVSVVQSKFRFTILIFKAGSSFVICLYADEPIRNNSSRSLWIYGQPRENPHIKETGWITKRQYIVDKMPANFQEAILSHDGYFYEGLTSNICFVFDSGIKTPKRSLVLPGLYLKKVENLCRDLKIPFEEDMISFDDVKNCIGIFTTSIF
jgi:branched-subunit amino acid aminotransferase/4-amino-4-deoxychorismate lyase